MSKERPLRAGLCGLGNDAYWSQFAGLEQRLIGYIAQAADRLARAGVEVVNLGLIDTPMRSSEAGHQCRREDIDVLFLYMTTYALSNTVLPLVQRSGVPVVVLNLQPEAAIDYKSFNQLGDRTAMTGEWLAHCSACPVPELANLFNRARHPVPPGHRHVARSRLGMKSSLARSRPRSFLSHGRLGLMGHYYSGMLDIMTDVTQLSIAFGTHVEGLEVDELSALAPRSAGRSNQGPRGAIPPRLRRAARLPAAKSSPAPPAPPSRWTRLVQRHDLGLWPITTRALATPPMKTP
jgi:L-arabinose isomerase